MKTETYAQKVKDQSQKYPWMQEKIMDEGEFIKKRQNYFFKANDK